MRNPHEYYGRYTDTVLDLDATISHPERQAIFASDDDHKTKRRRLYAVTARYTKALEKALPVNRAPALDDKVQGGARHAYRIDGTEYVLRVGSTDRSGYRRGELYDPSGECIASAYTEVKGECIARLLHLYDQHVAAAAPPEPVALEEHDLLAACEDLVDLASRLLDYEDLAERVLAEPDRYAGCLLTMQLAEEAIVNAKGEVAA